METRRTQAPGAPARAPRAFGAAICAGALCLAAAVAGADEKRLLTDAELAGVTAGTASVAEDGELLTFEAVKQTRSGRTIEAGGNLRVVESLEGLTVGNLTLSDAAQRDLRSVVNINAVNSAVNVLLNLNVNVDSSVGTLNQLNFNDALPSAVPPARPAPPHR